MMGCLKYTPKLSSRKDAGQEAALIGSSKFVPNLRCVRDGQISRSMLWLKYRPNVSFWRDSGHTTPVTGWSNSHPNNISSTDAGHTTPSKISLLLKTKPFTLANLSADCFASIDPGDSHVTLCGRTGKTRVKHGVLVRRRRLEASSPKSAQRCLGVLLVTRKCSADTFRHAAQSCNDASWSCMIDVYSLSPWEWFRATRRASRHRLGSCDTAAGDNHACVGGGQKSNRRCLSCLRVAQRKLRLTIFERATHELHVKSRQAHQWPMNEATSC